MTEKVTVRAYSHVVCECGHGYQVPVDAKAEAINIPGRCPYCGGIIERVRAGNTRKAYGRRHEV